MDIAALQKEIDDISIILYQNREQEAIKQMGGFFGKLKELTDVLLEDNNGDGKSMVSFISVMYQNLNDAYKHKDMLGMADCLQEYAALAVELYKARVG